MLLSGGRLLVAAVAVTVLAVSYAAGNLLGGSVPAVGTTPARPPGASMPSTSAPSAPPAAEEKPEARPAAIATAGKPPRTKIPSGPFGSRRTTGAPYVALTFDDGPDPRWTPQVLALLREHAVAATFCLVGELALTHPDLVRAIAEAGHTLCNHSWSHDLGLGQRSRAGIRDDLERTNAAIRAAAPYAPVSYFRAPGGNWTRPVVEVAAALGMASLHWTVDPQDWREPGSAAIAGTVLSATGRGAIVLLHDGGGQRGGTVRALARILPELTGRLPLAALPPGPDPRVATAGAS